MQPGIVRKQSRYSVEEAAARLQALFTAKGITLFALIDHAGEAASVGLRMPPTKLLIFGSPRAGTPVMLAAPSAALDLPLKILVAEDADGSVWMSWNAPAYLRERHGFPAELTNNLAAAEVLVSEFLSPGS